MLRGIYDHPKAQALRVARAEREQVLRRCRLRRRIVAVVFRDWVALLPLLRAADCEAQVSKRRVQRHFPNAYCVRLSPDSSLRGYIVWPGSVQPRGFERPAIGFGATARQAWKNVLKLICNRRRRSK